MISVGEADVGSRHWCWIEGFAEWVQHQGMAFPIINETHFSILAEKWIDAGPYSPFSFDDQGIATYEDRAGKDLRYSRLTVSMYTVECEQTQPRVKYQLLD